MSSQNGDELLDTEIEDSGESEIEESGGDAPDTDGAELDEVDPSTTADDGSLPPRDVAGRFKRSSGREAKRDLLSTETDTAPVAPVSATDRGTAGTTDGPAGATAPAPTGEDGRATPEKLDPQPWTVTEDGAEVPVDGAVYLKGHGVLIPEAKLADTARLISRGVRYEKQWRQMREMQEQLKVQSTAPAAEVMEAKLLLEELKPLMNPENADAFADFMVDPQGNLSRIVDRVEKKMLAAENERLKQGLQSGREAVEQVDSQEQMAVSFQSAFQQIAEHPYFKGKLPADQLRAAYEKLSRHHPRFFRHADVDMPEYGVRKGELILEQQIIIDELEDRVALTARLTEEKRRAQEEADRVAKLQRENERRTRSPRPATAPVARATTGRTAPQPQKRLTARDARRDLLDTEIEE